MAGSADELSWGPLFEQHQLILEQHLELLTNMHKKSGDESAASELIQTCFVQTETMMRIFNESKTAFLGFTHPSRENHEPTEGRESLPAPNSAQIPVRHPPNQPDPDALFIIDPNPTPLEELLRNSSAASSTKSKSKANSKAKRKVSDVERRQNGVNVPSQEQGHSQKKARLGDQPDTGQNNEVGQTTEEGDSFVREVEARHRAKEERRKKRLDRKRKRASDASSTAGREDSKPNRKKLKRHKFNQPPETSAAIDKDAGIGNQQQQEKRPRAEPDVTGNAALRPKQGGVMNKKRKKTKP